MNKKNPTQWVDGISLAMLAVTMCSQVDVRRIGKDTLAAGLGYATKTLSVALSDVVFAVVVLYFVARTIQLKAWRKLWWPPLPCWALILALVISAVHSPHIFSAVSASVAENGLGPKAIITKESKEAIAEIVQWAGYFLVAPWVFVNLLWDRRGDEPVDRVRLAVTAFFAAGTLNGLGALYQSFQTDEFPLPGFFMSPNMLSAFAALFVAFFASSWFQTANKSRPVLSGGVNSVALIGIACALLGFAISSSWAFVALAIGGFAALLVTRRPAYTLIPLAALVLYFAPASTPTKWERAASLRVASTGGPSTPGTDEPAPEGGETKGPVKKQLVEWQAAANWNTPRDRAFANGVGPGNYQFNIGALYGGLPNEEKMPPDSNNLYLVQAVSIGILGLGALLWVVGHFFGLAWRAARSNSVDWLPVSVVAALSAWLFMNLFHAMIVRGAGLVLAFLFALAVVAANYRNQRAPAVSEN